MRCGCPLAAEQTARGRAVPALPGACLRQFGSVQRVPAVRWKHGDVLQVSVQNIQSGSVPRETAQGCQSESVQRLTAREEQRLPPEEKRVVRHNTIYIDLNTPYKKYKGIYYCKK